MYMILLFLTFSNFELFMFFLVAELYIELIIEISNLFLLWYDSCKTSISRVYDTVRAMVNKTESIKSSELKPQEKTIPLPSLDNGI